MPTNQKPTTKILLSTSYWFGARSLGLLLHPYITTRRIAREHFYRPLIWLPTVCIVIWWIAGFIISRISILARLRLGFLTSSLDSLGLTQITLTFIFTWILISAAIWQLILSYLWQRFKNISK